MHDAAKSWPHLQAFVAVAQHLSFTRAAAALEISPQAVSVSIAQLEKQLNLRLFNRTTRSVGLTNEGERLLAASQATLDQLQHSIEALTQTETPSGLVRVSVASGFSRRYLLPETLGLSRRYPRIRMEISSDDRTVDPVRDGFDIVIRAGKLNDSNLISRRVCTLHTALVASPAYLRKAGVPWSPTDLQNHRLIGVRFLSGQRVTWSFGAQPDRTLRLPEPALVVSDPEAVAEAASLGFGIGAVALHHAAEALRKQRLKMVLRGQFRHTPLEMAIQYPHREQMAPRVRCVVEYLLERFAVNPDLHLHSQDLRAFEA
jgi:DNA-binding transcriptional LysR family regulator